MGFFFVSSICSAQNQQKADSLVQILNNSELSDSLKMKILKEIYINHTNQDAIIHYAEQAVNLALNNNNKLLLINAYLNIGHANRNKGNLEKALEKFISITKIADENGYTMELAAGYSAIGDVYSVQRNSKNALSYYNQAIYLFRELNDSTRLATSLLNTGDEYFNSGELDSAFIYFNESTIIFEKLESEIGKAYNIGNIGLIYAKRGNYDLAEENIKSASEILERLGDRYPLSVYQIYMAEIYNERGDFKKALFHAQKGYDIGFEEGLKEQIRDASLKLSELYEATMDYQKAYYYQELYMTYKDSLVNAETIQRMADLRTDFEVAQKQTELDLANKTKENQRLVGIGLSIVLLLLGLLAFVLFRNNQKEKRSNLLLSEQKEEITSQRDQLSDLNNTKDRFFSIISHDLRGPVNAFQGVTRIIKTYADRNQLEKIPAVLEVVDKSSSQLSSLLDNLLNWALSQQGNFPYHPEQLNFAYISEELLEIFKHMSLAKQINLSAHVDEEVMIYGDRNSVMAILRNLINNALKFTPQQGEIKLEAMKNGQFAYISVKDNGMGIPPDKIDNLFVLKDKKQSVDGTAGEKGTGLGLMICKEFAELNGGDIKVESEVGVGTSFTVNLPLFTQESQQV